MKSSIFFRNLTCMDHAFIDDEGMIHGASFHISATLTGNIDNTESVVLDFSKGKKQLKALIDDPETGMDHKLLIYPFSKCVVDTFEDIIKIDTPFFSVKCPRNAVRIITKEGELSEYLSTNLQAEYPGLDLSVKAKTEKEGFTQIGTYFNYLHGLKSSSSWGCQNQNHGHLSFVEVEKNGHDQYFIRKAIAEYLHDTVLIFRENIVSETETTIEIEYTTIRGEFTSTYSKPTKWLVLETETTIEYIIQHIAEVFKDKLHDCTLRISEGLSKGAELYVN